MDDWRRHGFGMEPVNARWSCAARRFPRCRARARLGTVAHCHRANGADGISDIEGEVARVATSKLGNERVSIDRFIAEDAKGPYPDME
jgi:hypothetical protein